jgi:hypothetical protein
VDRKSERRNADNIIVKKIHSELIYVQKEGWGSCEAVPSGIWWEGMGWIGLAQDRIRNVIDNEDTWTQCPADCRVFKETQGEHKSSHSAGDMSLSNFAIFKNPYCLSITWPISESQRQMYTRNWEELGIRQLPILHATRRCIATLNTARREEWGVRRSCCVGQHMLQTVQTSRIRANDQHFR